MLAEKRCKQKWSDDPRNTRWSKDQNGYGYRMLERMGWSHGHGLGKREEGRKEHVRVTRRDNNSGVGFDKNHDDGWIEHQEAFDQILAGLNAEMNSDPVTSTDCSSEARSLLSSAVHSGRAVYKKFLQSKDLSVASSDDLNCVLGKRGRESARKRGRENKTSAIMEAPVTTHGVTTITHKLSVQEYFATKLSRTTHADTSLENGSSDIVGGVGGGCEGESGGGEGDSESVETDLQPAMAQHCEPRKKRRKRSSKKHKH